ncbi:MAG: hypothetical protein QW733_06100 [Desulfurococcaceae archaeon]
MNVMKPCLLNVSGIPNSKIIRASVRQGRNNAIKIAELVVYDVSIPPQTTTIAYGTTLFTGVLKSVARTPCGKKILKYESQPPPGLPNDTLFLPLHFFAVGWSPVLVNNINNHIAQRSYYMGAIRPIPPNTLLYPGEYFFMHPDYHDVRWRVRIWYFVGNKQALLQEYRWKQLEPYAQNISLSDFLLTIFGGFSDEDVIYGSFTTVIETRNGGMDWYLTILIWNQKEHTHADIVVADTNCTSIIDGTQPFTLINRPLAEVGDVLEYFGYSKAGQDATLFRDVFMPAGTSMLEFIRRFCKGVTVRQGVNSYQIVDTLSVNTTHVLQISEVFDYSTPEPRYVNAEFQFENTTDDESRRRRYFVIKTYPNAVDTIKVNTHDYMLNTLSANRFVKQVLEDAQEPGYIKSIILPSIQVYDLIQFNEQTFRVVGYTHEISAKGTFTNIQIIPEVSP